MDVFGGYNRMNCRRGWNLKRVNIARMCEGIYGLGIQSFFVRFFSSRFMKLRRIGVLIMNLLDISFIPPPTIHVENSNNL